jgi:DNA polymerase-1
MSSDRGSREEAKRQAVNVKIQSLGSDICFWTMMELDAAMARRRMRSLLIGNKHDELILDCPHMEEARIAALLLEAIVARTDTEFNLQVPMRLEIKAGPNLQDLEPIGSEKKGGI